MSSVTTNSLYWLAGYKEGAPSFIYSITWNPNLAFISLNIDIITVKETPPMDRDSAGRIIETDVLF